VEAELAARPPLAAGDLRIDGRGVMALLGLDPGPEVGAALRHALEAVLEDPRRNTRASLEAELRSWWAGRDS
jgi:hypothetical protein